MTDCIFCTIAEGKSPAFKIRENDAFIAFLDLFPNTKGQTLVIPKKHYVSDLFLIEEKGFYENYLEATREVVNLLKKGLGVHRVAMVMEGMGVNHLHIKLYPLHGLGQEWKETNPKETTWFDQYEGYVSTQMGEKADFEVLGNVQMQINNAAALN
ncbi:MAG: HIT domain-containing protein [Candidatus Peribacteria bacterium]|jgi:diadenosine tetraphosphate (Ap4A) HIT family hydrolase|nr:HIT domain-containing protein [Candidatus Peribacteria bacterium]